MYPVYLAVATLAGIGIYLMTNRGLKMRISQQGIQDIMTREGFSATPYPDQAGNLTIGYGHKILPSESFTSISEIQGKALLINDLAVYQAAINNNVTVPLTQSMYDSLVSFVYNVGIPAFESSTMLKELNQKNYVAASNEFDRWKYVTVNGEKVVSDGLLSRRQSETQQFWA